MESSKKVSDELHGRKNGGGGLSADRCDAAKSKLNTVYFVL